MSQPKMSEVFRAAAEGAKKAEREATRDIAEAVAGAMAGVFESLENLYRQHENSGSDN